MFFRRFAKAEALTVGDAHEFVLDCLITNIEGMAGAKKIRTRKVDASTIAIVIHEQEFLLRIEEVAVMVARKHAKRAGKKTVKQGTKVEGQSDAG